MSLIFLCWFCFLVELKGTLLQSVTSQPLAKAFLIFDYLVADCFPLWIDAMFIILQPHLFLLS